MNAQPDTRSSRVLQRLAGLAAVLALLAPGARAIQFSNGELKGSFDSTLSFEIGRAHV